MIPSFLRAAFWKAFIYLRWLLPSAKGKGIELGQRIPGFTLTDLSGRTFALSEVFPKRSALLWLTNLCSSCEERIALLQGLHESSRDKLAIFAISILGDDKATPERILRSHRMTFPLMLDPDDWVLKELKLEHPAGACPMFNLLLVDRSGRIALRHHLSAISDAKLFDALRSIEAS